ncbi:MULTISPECIES: D-glucuronyl C5-epimerase family protein [Vibrio]|uniref:D-glucuronyl C5-epimerase family protein n=1 Tax=Vibrio TaxID=662 RepID=UPI001CDCAD02|nr:MULTISPECIES: D-glucuronyl C5-epimerase family protein [Vibrio]MDW2296336.1 D-glucuronyl C5-epimerase family protein [Vibrio sp. 1404]EKP4442246.1 hypothetical protein [Vibrio alginolyticus]MCA2457438.1 D-glucuronyl C5-epimerase family protein [Vibrio alginolyticus]MCA2461942.1 D-glucuronyl C5-epimerase family protein [Vibrio alginolyticus]MCR9597843.1 D-glucuronyl C5-epimerase family protein [Vibrio alginolyticus]
MFIGKSQFHKEQSIGKLLCDKSIRGYPSDLTEKTIWNGSVDNKGIILNKLSSGEEIYFPIAIAQKALGHYDLYLLNNSIEDKNLFLTYCKYLRTTINEYGLIETWHKQARPVINNYSSMTQGQVISCFCRAYLITNDDIYIEKSYDLFNALINPELFLSYSDSEGRLSFSEMPNENKEVILNGWIFTLWGLMDLGMITNNDSVCKVTNESLAKLANSLDNFSCGYWSKYDDGNKISSPFYHQLHIHQLNALYLQTGIQQFKDYANTFESMKHNSFKKLKAIIIKSAQKLKEKKYNEFI